MKNDPTTNQRALAALERLAPLAEAFHDLNHRGVTLPCVLCEAIREAKNAIATAKSDRD